MKPTRHHVRRYPLIPKFWQPKVKPSLATTCSVMHWDNLTQIVAGTATEALLWDWVECCLTYSEMMRLYQKDGTDMDPAAVAAIEAQRAAYPAIVTRYFATGRVGFSGPELAIAREAAPVMDELISMDSNGIAWAARAWSDAELKRVKQQYQVEAAT